MPWSPPKPCAHPGCRALVPRGERWCQEHRREVRREVDAARSPERRKLYNSAAWKKVRRAFVLAHPVCSTPGCGMPVTDVDHVVPVEQGGAPLSWSNLDGKCHACHSRKTASRDGGFGNPRRGGGGSDL